MATSDFGNEIQEDLNAVVWFDEKFNNAIVTHSLDLKDQSIFRNPNPINVTFPDMKKIDLVNPVTAKLATQVKASKLTDYELTKKLLNQDKVDKLQLRLDALRYGANNDKNDNAQQEMDDIVRRLDSLRGNTCDVSPDNTQLKILELLPKEMKKDFKIGKSEKEKEKFQIYQKE